MGKEHLWFTRLRLDNWRNFVQVNAAIQRRCFIIGPNASGKSNLLDVFRFVHDLVSVGGGLQEALRRRGGVQSIRCLAARRKPDVSICLSIGHENNPDLWTYELAFSQASGKRSGIVTRERVERKGKVLLDRPSQQDLMDTALLTQTALEQISANREFREIADVFASVRYMHIVPQLVRDPDRSPGRRDDPFGGDFLEQIARTPEKERQDRFDVIISALRAAVPQLSDLKLRQDEGGRWHLRGKYEHWRARGAWQTEESFSDGTLRLFGLLWATLDGIGPLLLEEPELSLHPDVIRQIPQLFARVQRRAGRQIVVSTHSLDLLSDEGIGLDEVLMLIPGQEGTEAQSPADSREVRELVAGGLSLAETLLPFTRPALAVQLAMFGDENA